MSTGVGRPVSGRRGMTVLGKVPKPVNLPSQRLENRGLDPNVEIVPRGSVSWGGTGSPPTSASPWGNSAQSSPPPVSSGPWAGAPPRPSTAGSSGSATASGGPGTVSSGPWGGHPPRPSSAGNGTRPSSAGSLRQTQETVTATNAWGPATARPSSASGVLGQAQPQSPAVRPRSAETRAQAPALTRFAEQTNGPAAPSPAAWGGAGGARKLGEEPHQPARFTLTRVDFPTLGSEKNPDLRPQQNKTGASGDRPASVDERVPPIEERPPSGPTGPYDEPRPTSPGAYGGQEKVPEGWRREGRSYGGHPGMTDASWHKEGPAPIQPYGGVQPPVADTWRREPGHGAAPGGGPSDDNWRRGGPPVGPYGPAGPGRFQPDPAFMHQQRYGPGPGPGPYGRSGGPGAGPGPGGYGRHGDMYGNTAPFGRPGGAPPRPGHPMGPGMYQGPGPYDNYYGPPGPGYGNMDEREMMMLGMNGPPGMYGNYPQGPPVEPYGRFPHGGPGPGPRHMPNNLGINRERNESIGYEGEGYREGPKYKDNVNYKDGAGYKDGGAYTKESGLYKDVGRLTSYQDPGESRRAGHVMSSNLTTEMQRPSSRGGHQGIHRDWAAAASSDEPMDFSKPVFEEDISSASPGPGNKTALSEPGVDGDTIQTGSERKHVDHFKIEDSPESPTEKAGDGGEEKDAVLVQAPKSSRLNEGEHVQSRKLNEVESGGSVSKNRVEDISPLGTKDQLAKKVQVSEGSESSEKRWGRGYTRDRSFGREPNSLSHTGRALGSKKETNLVTSGVVPSGSTSLRPGLHASGSSKSRPTTPSVTQGSIPSTAETLVSEEVPSPPVQEKHMQPSDPTSPSGSDGQKSNEKVRILKRVGDGGPESPHSDIVNSTETSSTDISISSTTAEALVKDDTKPKSKSLNNHDGEKEWRPKVVPASDIITEVPRPSSAANPKQLTSGAPLSGEAAGSAEKAGIDSGNLSSVESYDYEAQRVRMKEIAAQRAIQLRKEEDERIKEQKAKALAKLEELNRRSLVASVSKPEDGESRSDEPTEPTEEPAAVIIQTEEIEVVISEAGTEEVQVLETMGVGTGASTPRVRNGRNEHGKRERAGDRKSNGRSIEEHRAKMGPVEHRELTKARTTALSSQVKIESILPPTSQQATTTQASLLSQSTGHANPVQQDSGVPSSETSGSLGTQVQQQVPPKAQEARHRGKQSASQLKQAARQPQSSVEPDHPAQGQGAVSESTDRVGGWPAGTSALLDLDPKDVTLSLGSNVVSSEGAAAGRKKKTKNSGRNKHKLEGLTVSTDSTSLVDSNQGWNDTNDSGTEVGKPTPKALTVSGGDDALKALPSSVSQKDLDLKSESVASDQSTPADIAGSDGGSLRSNGEILSRKPQRKSQLARDRRVPARERGTSQDVRVGDKSHGGDGMIWAPVKSPSGVHPAGPKGGFGSDSIPSADTAVEKKEESVVAPQTGRARRAELERYTPKPVVKQQAQQQEEMQQHQQVPVVSQNLGNESADVPVTSEVPQNSTSLSEIKFGSEARQAETSSKQSRSHASWRQRASGTERLSAHKESNQVQHSESVETGGKSQQPSHHNHTQQNYHRSRPMIATSEQSRPGSSHQTREVSRVHSSTSVEEKEQQNLEGSQQGRSSHSHLPAAAPAATERESKAPQEGVTPYQPPRPGSSQKNRGLESDAQSLHEPVRSHRINTSQDNRQHGAPGKFDRDHHGSHERGQNHQQSRSHSFRHDRDQSQAHSGSHQQQRSAPPLQPSAPEGASTTREQSSLAVGAVQGRSASQSLHEKHPYTDREQRQTDRVGHQQPRSPPRQRVRQQAVAHEREQGPASHAHQQPRYRQPGQEKDHHRDVPNAVHHQQHQRGTSDGHWQQAGVAPPERSHPSTDLGHSNEHTTRSTSQKSQVIPGGSVDKDQPPALSSSQQHSGRSDPQSKPQGTAPNESQKQPQYQPVSQHQRPHQVSQGPKVDPAHNSSHWNGERPGSPSAFRGREHGHPRRGRFGGRYSGSGRGGEIEHRREQLSKQRLPIDAAGGAVPSQVGG